MICLLPIAEWFPMIEEMRFLGYDVVVLLPLMGVRRCFQVPLGLRRGLCSQAVGVGRARQRCFLCLCCRVVVWAWCATALQGLVPHRSALFMRGRES